MLPITAFGQPIWLLSLMVLFSWPSIYTRIDLNFANQVNKNALAVEIEVG